MSTSKTIPVFLLSIVLSMLIAGGTTAHAQPGAFLSVSGTWITDGTGNPILLRGVNYPGYEQTPPKLHTESDYATFAQMGFNVVRLPISWTNLEPTKGQFNSVFLWWYVDQDVAYAKKYGLYIVLDMHQDSWARKFGGEGAPDWAVRQYSSNDLGMREAVSNFWADPSIQEQLAMVWRNIANYYANEPTIAGYDLLNEPMLYTSIIPTLNESNVDAFYSKTTAAIRAVDPNHIIFLEPSNSMYTVSTPSDSKVVWEPHFYPLSYYPEYYPENITILQADLMAKYQEFVLGAKTPIWIGEFGAFMTDKSANNWLSDAKTLFDQYQVGWAWWASKDQSKGYSIVNCLQNPTISVILTQAPPVQLLIPNPQNRTKTSP